jgi:uncharacterized membrane protein
MELLLIAVVGLVLHAFYMSADMKNIKRELHNLEDKLDNREPQRTEIPRPEQEIQGEDAPYPTEKEDVERKTEEYKDRETSEEIHDQPVKDQSMEKKTEDQEDLETRVGSNYLSKIGIIGIIAGMGFFLKYSFDNGWIGPIGQIMIGVLVGIILLSLGEYFDKKYSKWAKSFTGGGIAILYFSVFAAYNFYELINPSFAFGAMSLITILCGILSIRYDSIVIALLGILGGFSTPLIIPTDVKNYDGLLSYLLILNLGVIGVASFKKWPPLNFLAFLLTAFFSSFVYYALPLSHALFFLTFFFVLYASIALIYNLGLKKAATEIDLLLILANALFFFIHLYSLLNPLYHAYIGLIALGIAIFYIAQAFIAYNRNQDDSYLALTMLGLAVTFVAVAIAIQFKQHWITIGWSAEALLLIWAGFQLNRPRTRIFGIIMLTIASIRLLFMDTVVRQEELQFIWNSRVFAYAVVIVCLYLMAYLYTKYKEQVQESEKGIVSLCLTLGNIFSLIVISLEIYNYSHVIDFNIQTTYTFTWTIYALILLSINRWVLKIPLLSTLGILLIYVMIFNTLSNSIGDHGRQLFLFNAQFGSYLFAIGSLYLLPYMIAPEEINENNKGLLMSTVVQANILTLFLFSTEIWSYFDNLYLGGEQSVARWKSITQMRQVTLSIVWGVYAALLIIAGIIKRYKSIRILALIIFGITIFKVVIIDLSGLDTIYRIIALIIIGIILIFTSFLYQKYKQQMQEFILKD